jgi:hypothetical protein
MLTPTQAFRAGFLLRCAQEGLTPEETDRRAEMAKTARSWADFATMSTIGKPLMLGAGIGTALGAGAGLLARSSDSLTPEKPPYVDDIHRAELAATFRQQADALRRQTQALKRRMLNPVPKSPFRM